MKVLVIAKRCGDGYEATVPRLPGCGAHGATLAEATAKVTAAIRERLAAESSRQAADDLEVVVAENVWQERRKGDGLDDVYNQYAREFDPLSLESLFNVDQAEDASFDAIIEELEAAVK
jgi:predicted RNase H-like HicB family nuclease